MTREFTKVGVVGLGTMGAGIVEVFARAGLEVVGVDRDDESVERGRGHLSASIDKGVARGKLTAEEAEALRGRVTFTTEMADLADVDIAVEAVPEQIELKRAVFTRLDGIVGPDAILATNTSSLSVTDIATSTSDPTRVVGMHFFNPAPTMKLVEVIRTVVTDDGVAQAVDDLAERVGKQPVVVGDKAGFIANALLLGYLNHAVSMYETKQATREDIDAAMREGCGYPMGPLALVDLIGLDVCYAVLDTMYKQGRDRLHAPSPLFKQMITAGMLGRKSGRGFYTYSAPGSAVVVPDHLTPAEAAGEPAPGHEPHAARDVRRVGVVGSGTMAAGIVETFARGGFDVTVVARSSAKGQACRAAVARSLEKSVQRGRLEPQDRDAALARVTETADLDALATADLVVEAIAEDADIKRAMFENLDEICRPGAILATTTSSLPVIDCAVATSRPADVVGMHFFNPAQTMKLVEVVSTVVTAPDVTATVHRVCADLGKTPVDCGDRAGFIVNALLFPYLNDAIKMLEANYATADDIDLAMKAGCGLPMGPFELLDVVGLDVSLAIQRQLYLEFRERGLSPAPLLEHLVRAGYLGRKTGRGFREHA